MSEMIIIGSRYFFVILAALFVWESVLYILYERGVKAGNLTGPIFRQRAIMIVFYILAFFILMMKEAEVEGTWPVSTLVIAIGGLILLIFMYASSKGVHERSCPLLWNAVFFLFITGLIMLQRLDPARAQRQLIFSFVGYLVALLIPLVLQILPDFSQLKWLYLFITAAFLVSLFLFGTEVYGAKNWLSIGPVTFQPSEFAKFFYVLFLAASFQRAHTFKSIIFPSVASAALILMLVLQKDLGGAMLFFIVYLLIFYSATGRTFLTGLAILAFIGAGFIAYKLFPHVARRFDIWRDPWADPLGASYQLVQSFYALSSFGLWGIGLTRGIPLDIPFSDTDFIFAAICEEFGSLYGLFIIGLFILIFYRGVNIALRNGEYFGHPFFALLAVGTVGILSVQSFVILGGVTGLIPITGVTLPFVSYGGSSVFISFLQIGVLQWLHREKEELEDERYYYENATKHP